MDEVQKSEHQLLLERTTEALRLCRSREKAEEPERAFAIQMRIQPWRRQ
jgi:hypothetical protein